MGHGILTPEHCTEHCIDFLIEITNHVAAIRFYDRDKSSVMKLDKFPNTQKFHGGARIIKRRDITTRGEISDGSDEAFCA